MNCTHCRKPIGRDDEFDRLDAGVRLSDGTKIRTDVNLHPEPCAGLWWLSHHPAIVWNGRSYDRGLVDA